MSASEAPSASPGDDLAEARADAEKRYAATRHSSESEDLSTSEDERARKSKRLKKKTRRAERDAIWGLPEPDFLWLPYFHFQEHAKKHQVPGNPSVRWNQLPMQEREPFEKLALAKRSEHTASMATYNACVPLSPSLGSNSTSPQSSAPECGTLDSDYTSDDTRCFRRDEHERRRASQCWNRYRRDRATASQPVPPVPFAFMTLPPELRSGILQLLLGREKIVRQKLKFEEDDFCDKPIDTRLFAVSSAMRDEAEAVFYSSNRFQVSIDERLELPAFIQTPSPSIGALRLLRVLTVVNYNGFETDFIGLQGHFESLCRTLKQCPPLRELRFGYTGAFAYNHGWDVDNHSKFHTKFDKIMEPFAFLRGITRVVFDLPRLREPGYCPESSEKDNPIRPLGTETQRARLKAIMESPNELLA